MANKSVDPIRPTDDGARQLAREIVAGARYGSLGVLEADTGFPLVTRIAFGTSPSGALLALVSSLSQHTAALRRVPVCSVLVGEPGASGDPLTHPRLTLQCRAQFIEASDPARPALREAWLTTHPKAKVYIDFADFSFVRFDVERAFLNGGFGKAYVLEATDLDFV
ncbi:HugZ family protein [Tropicimonas marinistellae]|uniref:HugZ family pyridoxamine 5'-phosphate oxidase n=1 Tax=Tropicimonas marinistellae TaxID=1739787 RepID=UPI00082CDD28|nr:pyridoxamine 5-phosphate oxidase [Tropicimonas marinistellae]